MRPRHAAGVCLALAALVWSTVAAAGGTEEGQIEPDTVRILDVPYVPQSEDLCGGAAVAMVLRYWGKPWILAEDFASLVEPAGIPTSALVKAVGDLGWTALPLSGTASDAEKEIARGRPVIALIDPGRGFYHYVVLVAWANGWILFHDPNVGPFRAIREGEFAKAWSASGGWALLILPPPVSSPLAPPREASGGQGAFAVRDSLAGGYREPCSAMVEAGILLAQQGDTAQAELKFAAGQALCPLSAAPLRERAGLRFQAEDWAGASRLAERALALDPGDEHAQRLLAGSRFLMGDVEGALRAWNSLLEPRADLTRIDGLSRIRHSAVARQLGLPPGRLLTPRAFRQARRRLAEIPAQSECRLGLRPLPGGNAEVNAALLEYPSVFKGPWDLGSAGLQALTGREITIDFASPTGNGELWSAGWRWWRDRPRLSVALTMPAAGGRPGIWRVEGFWERQAYDPGPPRDSTDAAGGEPLREERRRTALSFSDWLGPDLRLEARAALDEWAGRAAYLSLGGGVETRWAGDRLALGAEIARWMSVKNAPPFGTGGLSLKWCSTGLERGDAWQGRAGISSTTSRAPLALWPGAGTGSGRAPLLRAHPLLNGGVLDGWVFGRGLVHATLERQAWPWELGPLRFGWAVFVDGARPWHALRAGSVPWQMDGGAGLRVRTPGRKGQLRIDAAHGLLDGNSALFVGWEIP